MRTPSLVAGANLLTGAAIAHATQVELMEMEAYLDMYAAAPDDFAQEMGLSTQRFGAGACFALKEMPASLFNRSLNVGMGQPATEEETQDAIRWLRTQANPAWGFGVAAGARPDALPAWLAAQDLQVKGAGMAKFWRNATLPSDHAITDLDVREVSTEKADDFGNVVAAAFGLPGSYSQWFKALPGRARWRTYVAYDGSTPAAVAAMFIDQGLAWLGVGATMPDYRKRGAQGALLSRRIMDAVITGVKGMAVDTGHPAPDAAIGGSYRNILRAGFEVSHVRPDYADAGKKE